MEINRNYISNNNTYSGITPEWIVIHSTDNYAAGANALAHAKAQHDGSFQGMSCHFYVDDGDIAYQAADYNHGCWQVGVNYGGRLFGTCSNRNAIGIEKCVQQGYNYEKSFQNAVSLCRQVMQETGIDADHVVQHYDVCAKNCPSDIRAHGDWERFKKAISGTVETAPIEMIGDTTVEAAAKVVEAEFGMAVGKNYNCLLGVAQCMRDMWEDGSFGDSLSDVLERNFTTPADTAQQECIQAVRDVFVVGVNRLEDAKILQYRSFTKYSDGNGNLDPVKAADVLKDYMYLDKDSISNEWGHFYFGEPITETERPETEHPEEKLYKVQVGAYSKKENAEIMKEKLLAAGFDAIISEHTV